MEPPAAWTTVSMLDATLIRRFATRLGGQLILPGREAYESARRLWNWAIDLRPGMIVRCANREDVTRAVDFARHNDLLVAVRSGGHSYAGHSTCEGGMVIDLSAMNGIRVDREHQIAHAEGGLMVGEFDKETQSLGLATPMGACAATGIAGLTLGGGLGWLTAGYGASCDNLLVAEVITADGSVLGATPQENQDLFWGIRGGGGNFGIATSLSYRLHPVTQAWGGMRAYPLAQGREVLRFFREFTATAPDELSSQAGIVPLADGPAFGILVCCNADLAAGERLLKPLRTFGRPLADSIRPMPYLEVQAGQSDVPAMERLSFHQKSGFLSELSDKTIDIIVSQLVEAPTPLCGSTLWHHHGAVCRVGAGESAFSFRQAGYYFWTQSFWQDRPAAGSSIEWVNRSWDGLRTFFNSAVYVNQLGDEGEERVRAAYGANYERLVALKNKYDPTNFFRMNQNIKPTA
jgi:hypothetical protein